MEKFMNWFDLGNKDILIFIIIALFILLFIATELMFMMQILYIYKIVLNWEYSNLLASISYRIYKKIFKNQLILISIFGSVLGILTYFLNKFSQLENSVLSFLILSYWLVFIFSIFISFVSIMGVYTKTFYWNKNKPDKEQYKLILKQLRRNLKIKFKINLI
ncbi:hypothetical protein ACUZ9N_01745 [Mycoplasmopsis gallinarum]